MDRVSIRHTEEQGYLRAKLMISIPFRLTYLTDIDSDGNSDSFTDASIILRFPFGLRDDAQVNGVIGSYVAVSTSEEVGDKIDRLLPAI